MREITVTSTSWCAKWHGAGDQGERSGIEQEIRVREVAGSKKPS